MGILIRVLLFLAVSSAIWTGDFWAQRTLLGRPTETEAVAAANGDDAAVLRIEARQQRKTALLGGGVTANFFVAIACFATFRRKPARGVVDRQGERQ